MEFRDKPLSVSWGLDSDNKCAKRLWSNTSWQKLVTSSPGSNVAIKSRTGLQKTSILYATCIYLYGAKTYVDIYRIHVLLQEDWTALKHLKATSNTKPFEARRNRSCRAWSAAIAARLPGGFSPSGADPSHSAWALTGLRLFPWSHALHSCLGFTGAVQGQARPSRSNTFWQQKL